MSVKVQRKFGEEVVKAKNNKDFSGCSLFNYALLFVFGVCGR